MSVESQAPETAAPDAATGQGGARRWFAALFRALFIILLTLAVLAALVYAADVALHRITRTSHSSVSYPHVSQIEVIVDGDGSVAVTGTPTVDRNVTLNEADRSTILGHPQRAVSLIGGTLFVAIRCPDSLCTVDLALATPPDTHVTIRVGNALRLEHAAIFISNLTGPVDISAWPANVTVTNSSSLVTGMVAGSVNCGVPAVCIVQVPR